MRRRSAIQWEFVSSVNPPTSSSPIATMLEIGIGDHINMERLHAVVRGDVQGVGFRYFVQRKANQLGLPGWVPNNDDGPAELVAEGDRAPREELPLALGGGPRRPRASRCDSQQSTAARTLTCL